MSDARTIMHVVGTRPNFIKVTPVMRALAERASIRQILVHTGQHYDSSMSDVFFDELEIPQPDVNLGVGSASHAVQTAQIMIGIEEVLVGSRPDFVLVYGDVNSTVAAALVSAKLPVPIGHVEAGLRSFDLTMPEEVNRVVTDRLADLLFTPSAEGDENLIREGVPAERIRRVGNVMIDTLVRLLPKARLRWLDLAARWALARFGLVTLHRPSNVDEPEQLAQICEVLSVISRDLPLLFPVHPRTESAIARMGIKLPGQVRKIPPLGYLDFVALQERATCVITDSGGIQEETTYLGIPCLTLRDTTERPVTITLGTNELLGRDPGMLIESVRRVLGGEWKQGSVPPLWDGRASGRIADVLEERFRSG
jgi:UDP-N-acetylglucosamine 2-epimerase (non-hydrolysing)